MKTIGIIGGTSMVAHYARRHFTAQNIRVITFGRAETSDYQWDITRLYENAGQFPKMDVVINTAAAFNGSSDMMSKVNKDGALNAYRLAAQNGCPHFVHLSSCFASDEQINSTPDNPYACSKREGDEALLQTSGPLVTILRPSQIVDPQGLGEKHQGFFYHVLRQAQHNETIKIYGDTDRERNYIHVNDLINIIAACIQNQPSGIYNVINPEKQSLLKLVAAAKRYFGYPQNAEFMTDKPAPPICYYPEADIFKNQNGDSIEIKNLQQIVADICPVYCAKAAP